MAPATLIGTAESIGCMGASDATKRLDANLSISPKHDSSMFVQMPGGGLGVSSPSSTVDTDAAQASSNKNLPRLPGFAI
jgi:hypothetical protein